MEEMSRDDVEQRGQRLGEAAVMPRVITLLQGLDDTRSQVIRLDPDTLVMYTRAIKAAAQQIGLPVMVKTRSDRMAMALETDEDRARHIRLNALRSRRARDGPAEACAAVPFTALQTLKRRATDARSGQLS
jgi:hypothetical protein